MIPLERAHSEMRKNSIPVPFDQPAEVTRCGVEVSAPWMAIVRTTLAILGCALLVAIGARVRIPLPFTPVPMTLQLLAVLLTGYLLRPMPAVMAMLVYLGAGTVGLPVFTAGSLGLWGVTGGYLFGFVVAGWVVSLIHGGGSASVARLLLAGAVGITLVLALGMVWTAWLFDLGFASSFKLGVQPFVLKAAVEMILAMAAVYLLQKSRMRRTVL